MSSGLGARTGRALALAAGVAALTLARPVPALAHAYLISTSPQAGARLGTTPGVVTLAFSESLQPGTSEAVVITPDGRQVRGTASAGRIAVPLTTNAPGVYRVTWKAVSSDDGHTTSGSFRFAVATMSGPVAVTGPGTPAWQDVLFAAGRTIEYAGLLFAMGVLALAWLARRKPAITWVGPGVRARLRGGLLVAFVATLAVVAGEAAVAEGSLSPDALGRFLSNGLPGAARLALLACEALALGSVAAGLWPLTGLMVTGALVAVAAASHAAAVRPVLLGVAVDALHLAAAGVWAGGILALVTLRPPEGWRGPAGRPLLERFSGVAVPAFLVSVGFGAVQGVQEVGGALSLLFTTSYGQVLLLKVAAIGVMLPLSWFAWRRKVFRRGEGLAAVAVVTVAAVLSVLPVPNTQARAGPEAGAAGLPRRGDLTLGDHAGQFLVGFTLRPGTPGLNHVLIYLKPVEGRAAGVPVDLTVGGTTTLARECGTTCRESTLQLRGGEEVVLTVGSTRGGQARFTVPNLPAPDGTALLHEVGRRMHALATYRLIEALTSGLGTTIATHYAFQAPDRMSIDVRGPTGSQSVWIGTTRYLKQSPSSNWQVQRGGPSQQVPSFIWDYFHPQIDARIVGRATVGGVRTRILAFFADQSDTPIWFRLWVDSTGRVHRATMRAFGHFMDDRYFDFDAELWITPPVSGRT
jgi:copper transport protein